MFRLILFLNVVEPVACARVCHLLPDVDYWIAPACRMDNRSVRKLRVSLDDRGSVTRSLPLMDSDDHVHFLSVRFLLGRQRHAGFLESITFQQVFDVAFRLGQCCRVEWCPQIQLCKAPDLSFVRRSRQLALQTYVPNKLLQLSQDPYGHAIAGRFRIHLNVFVVAGSKQPVDCFADLFLIELAARLQNLCSFKISGIERLLVGNILDTYDPSPVKVLGRTGEWREQHQEKYCWQHGRTASYHPIRPNGHAVRT